MRIIHDGHTPVLEVGPRDPVPVKVTVRRPGLVSGKMIEWTYLLTGGKTPTGPDKPTN